MKKLGVYLLFAAIGLIVGFFLFHSCSGGQKVIAVKHSPWKPFKTVKGITKDSVRIDTFERWHKSKPQIVYVDSSRHLTIEEPILEVTSDTIRDKGLTVAILDSTYAGKLPIRHIFVVDIDTTYFKSRVDTFWISRTDTVVLKDKKAVWRAFKWGFITGKVETYAEVVAFKMLVP